MKKYVDKRLLNESWIINKIQEESKNQINKHGIQTRTAFEWLTFTTEELGELAEAITEHEYRGKSKENIIKEAVQVATLALKIAEMYELE